MGEEEEDRFWFRGTDAATTDAATTKAATTDATTTDAATTDAATTDDTTDSADDAEGDDDEEAEGDDDEEEEEEEFMYEDLDFEVPVCSDSVTDGCVTCDDDKVCCMEDDCADCSEAEFTATGVMAN
jgi:hypothetical protein